MHESFCDADAEGRVGELRKAPQKPHLADFSLQRTVGLGDRNSGKQFRDKKGAGDSEDMLRGPL